MYDIRTLGIPVHVLLILTLLSFLTIFLLFVFLLFSLHSILTTAAPRIRGAHDDDGYSIPVCHRAVVVTFSLSTAGRSDFDPAATTLRAFFVLRVETGSFGSTFSSFAW
jgi:hypothetical protein